MPRNTKNLNALSIQNGLRIRLTQRWPKQLQGNLISVFYPSESASAQILNE